MTPTSRNGTLRSGTLADVVWEAGGVTVGAAGGEEGGWKMEDGTGGAGAWGENEAKPSLSGGCADFAGSISGRGGCGGVKWGNSTASGAELWPGMGMIGGGVAMTFTEG